MPIDHRYLWSTHFVRERIRIQGLSEAATFRYFLVIMIFDWLQFTTIATTPTPTISASSFASSWVTFGVTVAGLIYLYARNSRGRGRQFLQRYFALSVTVGWKFIAAMLVVLWLIEAVLVGTSPEFRGWSSTGTLAALNLAMLWRIGDHLASLARERAASPAAPPLRWFSLNLKSLVVAARGAWSRSVHGYSPIVARRRVGEQLVQSQN